MKIRDKKTGYVWDVLYISAKNQSDTIFHLHNVDEFECVNDSSDREIAVRIETRLDETIGFFEAKFNELMSAVKEQRGGGNEAQCDGVKTQPEGWYYPQTLKDTMKRVTELETQRVDLEKSHVDLADRVCELARAHKEALGQIDALRERVRQLESQPSPVNPAIPFPWNQPVVTHSNPVVGNTTA